MKNNSIKDIDYYKDGERVVFTALFHIKRGECCGNGCRHCPFDPQYQKGNKIVKEEFVSLKKKS
jgi:biotin synthase-like enzyme